MGKIGKRVKEFFGGHHGRDQPRVDPHDPTPHELFMQETVPLSISEQIAQAVHAQLAAKDDDVWETPEEADDFEEEDPDILDFSPYERHMIETHEEALTPAIEDPPEQPLTEEENVQQEEPEVVSGG